MHKDKVSWDFDNTLRAVLKSHTEPQSDMVSLQRLHKESQLIFDLVVHADLPTDASDVVKEAHKALIIAASEYLHVTAE